MAILDKPTLLAKINEYIDTTGQEGTTGAELIELLTDMADSLAFSANLQVAKLTNYNPSKEYSLFDTCINNGEIKYCVEPTTTGTFNDNAWVSLPVLKTTLLVEQWVPWVSLPAATIRRNKFKVWISLVDGNNVEPGSDPAKWQSIKVISGTFIDYLAGSIYSGGTTFVIGTTVYMVSNSIDYIYLSNPESIVNAINDEHVLIYSSFEKVKKISIDYSLFLEPGEDITKSLSESLPAGAIPIRVVFDVKTSFKAKTADEISLRLRTSQSLITSGVSVFTNRKHNVQIGNSIVINDEAQELFAVLNVSGDEGEDLYEGEIDFTIYYKEDNF